MEEDPCAHVRWLRLCTGPFQCARIVLHMFLLQGFVSDALYSPVDWMSRLLLVGLSMCFCMQDSVSDATLSIAARDGWVVVGLLACFILSVEPVFASDVPQKCLDMFFSPLMLDLLSHMVIFSTDGSSC